MPDPSAYYVGWICAIKPEYVAAQAFLDEKHERPDYVSTNDSNIYTLGRLGKHNVVIGTLPYGEYGIAAAVGVAKGMLSSFPNVRIGLMVGIGGGAPSAKNDIRLGDIVVSAPRNGHGGVFQYDFGKTIQEKKFQTCGFLNQPPELLRAALTDIQADYEMNGHRLEEAIDLALNQKPRLRQNYQQPNNSSDRLFRSELLHRETDGANCAIACYDGPSSLVERRERTSEEDNPAIHYGTIASANQLMKDAFVRDRLITEENVLCFEMEAAGLMNRFPCIVIRGICDYADSHKNKEWQGYAAMTAAAYAKDLLIRISPNKVEAEKKLSELIENVSEAVRTTGEVVTRIASTVAKDEDSKILNWLTPIGYGSRYSDLLKVRQPGTGQWFLDSAKYQTWLDTKKQTLFCPGIPGAGKTILATIVVENLFSRFENNQEVGIAYLYCDFQRQDKQKADDLLASLLRQLTQRRPSLPDELKALHDKHVDKQTQLSVDQIAASLQSVARMYSKVFIVVDALDECDKECMPTFLSQIFSLQASTTANVLATSRPIEMIKKKFEGRSEIANISARDEDVEKYLDNDMKTLPLLDKDNEGLSDKRKEDLRNEIKTALIKGVNGMFLLARLYLASLIDKTTESDLHTALKSLPKGQNALAQAYGITMERIRSQRPGFRYLAETVLTLLTCAKRLLTTLELQDALAVTEGDPTLVKTKRGHTSIIVSVCAGLVTVDADSGIIRLVHETTREYLASHMHCIKPQKALTIIEKPMELDDEKSTIAMADAHRTFAIICVTYLSFSDFKSGFCQTDAALKERLHLNQLYSYAAHNWGHHAREASAMCPSVIYFLNDSPKVEASSQALMVTEGSWRYNWSQKVPKRVAGLHLAAYFGIQETVRRLLRDWQNIDQKDSERRTPLLYAAWSGYEAIVKLLLATGKVDVNAECANGGTALLYAARNGHEAIVQLLLATGKVNVDAMDREVRTPLLYAARNGHEAIVRLLLATDKVDVDAEGANGRTPLLYAARNGHEAIVQLLLATDKVDVDTKDYRGQTPLSYAAEKGYEAIVKLLLATGKVDVNAEGANGRTPLSYAAEKGYEAIVKLLLATGKVDVNAEGANGRTPLLYAAWGGYEAIVKLLLATDKVDVDAKDYRGQTPLWYAVWRGYEAIVKLLLATGKVDVDTKDYRGQTPLSHAAKKGYEAIVQLLLATDKVDVDAKDREVRSPLLYAAEKGHEAIVRLLLATGKVDVNAKDREVRTPLLYAAENGHEAIVRLLLATDGVDVDAKDRCGWTPLSYAAEKGHEAIITLLRATKKVNVGTQLSHAAERGDEVMIKLLLATKQVDVDARDHLGRTPLLKAAKSGHEASVKLLLATGKVDLNAKDGLDRTPLSHAAWRGSKAVVKLLLALDKVDIIVMDRLGRTPLSYAAGCGHRAIVKLLLATEKVDVNVMDRLGQTPLSRAAWKGHEAIVKLLLATEKVYVDAKHGWGRTPLSYAAERGHVSVVKLLLATGQVNVDAKDHSGRTPLSYAAGGGHETIVMLLQV